MSAEFIIIGHRTGEGRVRLTASHRVRSGGEAMPVTRVAGASRIDPEKLSYVPDGWHIGAVTEDVVNVDADDYAEALAILMGIWRNADDSSPVAELFRGRQ